MADTYVPRDVPLVRQEAMKRPITIRAATFRAHIAAVLKHGPLPRNFEVQFEVTRQINKKGTPSQRYVDQTRNLKLWDHPNSPDGRRSNAVILDEFKDDREQITAVYNPPVPTFKVGRLYFHHHGSWQEAVAASLAATGCMCMDSNGVQIPVTEEAVRYAHKLLDEKASKQPEFELVHKLYHPADRNRAVFAGEPECARMTRHWSRDLAILAPHTPANGRGYDRFWQQVDRPPMRWYWSTGQQSCRKIATLACLPVYQKGETREAHWFTVTPSNEHKITWDSFFNRFRNFKNLHELFKLPKGLSTERAIWIIVAAHRTCVNGLIPKNVELGSWIHQYAKHMMIAATQQTGFAFQYKRDQHYDGRRIDVNELGGWISNNDATLKYMRLWEEANKAQLNFELDKTAAKMQVFQQRMRQARTPPP